MKLRIITLNFLILYSVMISAQTGMINYPSLGLSFTVPDGWTGREQAGSYIMGHISTPGLLAIIPHSVAMTTDEMKTEMQAGLQFDAGTKLHPVSLLNMIGSDAIGGEFEGTFDYFPANAYIIGAHNPHGNGVTIVSITSSDIYDSEVYKDLAFQVKNSLKFAPVSQTTEAVGNNTDLADWKYQLGGTKLTYMESYYSGGNYGGGYNMKTEIHLCPAGYFLYYDQNFVAAGGSDVSGYSGQQSKGHGNWDIQIQNSRPTLVLSFHDGNRMQFTLEWREDSKLFLDGYRYMRTWEGEYAPNCFE